MNDDLFKKDPNEESNLIRNILEEKDPLGEVSLDQLYSADIQEEDFIPLPEVKKISDLKIGDAVGVYEKSLWEDLIEGYICSLCTVYNVFHDAIVVEVNGYLIYFDRNTGKTRSSLLDAPSYLMIPNEKVCKDIEKGKQIKLLIECFEALKDRVHIITSDNMRGDTGENLELLMGICDKMREMFSKSKRGGN